jgi:hypothetical protein
LDKNAAIIAVCGIRKTTVKQQKLNPGEKFKDEWLLADFALFHHLLKQHPGPQEWLTDIDLNQHCETRGPLLHGPPSQSDRLTVHSADSEKFYTLTRTSKLCTTFLKSLNRALERSSRVVIIICAHGFEGYGGYVLLGRVKFYCSQLEMIVPTRLVGGAVTLLSTACRSGLFVSPRWTSFCPVPSGRSSSFGNRGGAWTGTLAEHGDELPEDFGQTTQEATVSIIAEDDKYRNLASTINVEELPSHQPTEAGTTSPEFQALITSYLSSQYPNEDAPSNHYIHYLLALYHAGRATEKEQLLLANAIRQRQAEDFIAMEIVGCLGVLPEVDIRDWTEDQDFAIHPYFQLVRHLVHKYNGFPYRKPMLYVVWVCKREGISQQKLLHALEKFENGEVTKKRKSKRRS